MSLDLSAADQTRLRLWLRMLKATRAIDHALRARLRRAHDTTPPRFEVLAALHRHPGGLKLSELARLLMVSGGNVTGIVGPLLDHGLIERGGVAGDRRAVRVRLSEQGRRRFEAMAVDHAACIQAFMAGLDEAEIAALTEALRKIEKRAD